VTGVTESERQARLFAALADPVRLRLVRELVEVEELSGSAIAGRLGISLALLCHHSRILIETGVVTKRKAAQTAYFRANRQCLEQAMRQLLESRG
jgi:DNA-binding transcriptional ArsR family regulator